MKIGNLEISVSEKVERWHGTPTTRLVFLCQGNLYGNESDTNVDELQALARYLLREAHRLDCVSCRDETSTVIDLHRAIS